MNRVRARGGMGALIVAVTLRGLRQVLLVQAQRNGEDFNRDSTQCISESSPTTPTLNTGVFVEQMYRLCLSAKGWVRDKQYDPPPPGWYRGVE
jgi:hypothetical protein